VGRSSTVREGTVPRMARRPSGFATFLAVVGAALLVVGASAVWIDGSVGDTASFTAQAGDLIEQPAIRTAMAEAGVEPLFEDAPALLAVQREIAVGLIAAVLADDRFVPAFRQLLRVAHMRLIGGEHGPVAITLEIVVDAAREDLVDISPELASRVDAIETPQVVVVARREAEAIRTLLDLVDTFGFSLIVVGAIMVVVASLRSGGRAFVASGVGAIVTSALLFVVLLATRAGVVAGVQAGRARAAVGAGWDVVVSGLLWTLAIAAGTGVAVAVLGFAFSGSKRARRVKA
jgi:hypothetical protein